MNPTSCFQIGGDPLLSPESLWIKCGLNILNIYQHPLNKKGRTTYWNKGLERSRYTQLSHGQSLEMSSIALFTRTYLEVSVWLGLNRERCNELHSKKHKEMHWRIRLTRRRSTIDFLLGITWHADGQYPASEICAFTRDICAEYRSSQNICTWWRSVMKASPMVAWWQLDSIELHEHPRHSSLLLQ
jgi:hypothetical protein